MESNTEFGEECERKAKEYLLKSGYKKISLGYPLDFKVEGGYFEVKGKRLPNSEPEKLSFTPHQILHLRKNRAKKIFYKVILYIRNNDEVIKRVILDMRTDFINIWDKPIKIIHRPSGKRNFKGKTPTDTDLLRSMMGHGVKRVKFTIIKEKRTWMQ